METGLVETLFEAITVGDEQQVELCLNSATIAIVLEFEKIYGESPLHLCVKLGGVSHLGVVRRLLASGYLDFDQRDNEGQTVLEYAYNKNDLELTKQLIGVEMEGLDDASACYKMLKHDSLDLFKLFLSMKNMGEHETFKNIASAFVKLNVKKFVLSKELRYFVQWKLSDYAYRNLSGNWPGVKDPTEWKNHIDTIDDCWRVISAKYDTRLYDDVDDQLLHRMQIIHNCLYFLKHKQFLNHLPMHEIVFCVAKFISVFNSIESNNFRMLVNKRIVIDFVRMVHRQLKLTKTHLEMVEKELTTIVQEAQHLDANAKDRLIEEMLEKLKATNFANKDHWIAETTKKINDTNGLNKDVLIKDMIKKIKSSDKTYFTKKIQSIDETIKRSFIVAIGKGDLHVIHPQNVANRLMAGWKKGKSIVAIVAEAVGEECFDLKHHLRGKDRCIIRQSKKLYGKTRQLYSLQKVIMYWDRVMLLKAKDDVTIHAIVQRMIQVLGETLKNTQNSPNMPGMVEQMLKFFLSATFLEAVKCLREVYSHGVSLKKELQGNDMYKVLRIGPNEDFDLISATFHLLHLVTLEEAMETMYGSMRRCGSYDELRSFMLYVDDVSETEKYQKTFYENIRQYFDGQNNKFKQLAGSALTQTEAFVDQIRQFKVKRAIVKRMGKDLESNQMPWFPDIQQACFVGDDISATRRTLDLKLTRRWANKFWTDVRELWKPIHTMTTILEFEDKRLAGLHPFKMTSFFSLFQLTMDRVERIDYILQTRKLIQDLGLADSLDENAVQELNQRLKPYYSNIVLVQSKWGTVKSFCTNQKIVLNEGLVNKLTNKDQAEIQQLFDDHREKIRFIFEQYGINNVETLVKHIESFHTSSVFALEYLQLVLNEMLVSVGYFGDSFQYMKYRLPVIQGKNYRNFLAHDSLSYNILTDSSGEKIIINAYVLGYTKLKLFANRVTKSDDITTALPTVKETHEWANEQHRLLDAFRTKNVDTIVDAIKNGGEIRSQFCCSPNKRYIYPIYVNLTKLVDTVCNAEPMVLEFLNKYYSNLSNDIKDPARQLQCALLVYNFQTAFDQTIGRGDTEIREELFLWPELIPSLRETDFFNSEAFIFNKAAILKKLISNGNERGVREMLPYFDVFLDQDDWGPLGMAILCNVKSIADILFPHTLKPHLFVVFFTIVVHWNDLFFKMMVNFEMDSQKYQILLRFAAYARNYRAAECLLEHDTFKQFIPEVFKDVCRKAAWMGETAMLQHLLNIYPTTSHVLAKIIYHAALHRRWKCVGLLLDRDAPVDALYPKERHREDNTLVILVRFGLWRLIDRVRSVNCRIYADGRAHPLAVAIEYGNASASMVRALQRLGFDWLDNSIILHKAIEKRDNTRLAVIWKMADAVPSEHLDTEDSHFALAIKVLLSWQMIGFVEESTTENIPLTYAINNNDEEMVKRLLDRAKIMRQLEGIGILNNIVFKTSTSIVCFGERSENHIYNVENSCKYMITRLKSSAMLDMGWQEFTIDLGVPVEFHVLSTNKEKIDQSQQTTDFDMRKSGSLLNSLNDFMMLSNALFAEATVIAARFKQSEGTSVYFWQVEDISCVYNILPLGAEIDLSPTVNYRDLLGETPLHTCMNSTESLAIVKMLVEAGADPLLTTRDGITVIYRSVCNANQYGVLNYLLDVCQDGDLRDGQGVSFLDLEDNIMKNRLIHIAALNGRRDLIERLLQLNVDVSVKNSFGCTPALMALNAPVANCEHIIKLLLDYNSSSIDEVDRRGKSLLHYAVKYHSIEVLQEILKHDPNITTICNEGHTPLYAAICFKKINLAKCLLRYAIEKGIHGITRIDEVDLVSFSLQCNDFRLSKSLLEYELEHPLEEISVADLNRIEALLNSTVPEENVNVSEFVQSRELPESKNFIIYLEDLCISLRDQ